MKKNNKFFILFAIVLFYALVNTILFLTIPDARLDSKVFWLVWAFMTPVSLLATIALFLWGSRKSGNDMVSWTVSLYLIGIFALAYFIVGFIFAYLPWKSITLPLIIELVITVAYIIAVIYFMIAANYIRNQEKETKSKVLTIRLLKADLDEGATLAKSESLKVSLQSLSDDVRFSDPMSHPSLSGMEAEIFALVSQILEKIKSGEEDIAESLVKDAQVRLKNRNARCLLLK